jgi:hypothetical protein
LLACCRPKIKAISANAKDTKIAKKDIASREKSAVSLMPADLLAYMTEDDLVNMVAYLFTLKTKIMIVLEPKNSQPQILDYWLPTC